MKNISLAVCCTLGLSAAWGQNILDGYIKHAVARNEPIQQQQFVLEQSMLALKEARKLYLPKLALQTDYFLAGGGRTVDFPTGQLLNSVYSTLNALTNSNSFPQLKDERILLNPNNFYDAKIRTTVPIINKDLKYNKTIREKQVSLQDVEIKLYKRELVKEVKTAYYQYMQASQAVKIYQNALVLLYENNRINESLLKNDKVNRTIVLRSKNELVKYEALKEAAIQSTLNAQAYFNFLLNRELTEPIQQDSTLLQVALLPADTAGYTNREELLKLKIAEAIQRDLTLQSQNYKTPKISAFLDLGSQGFEGKFNNHTRYYFFGVSLQWDIFSAGINKLKTEKAKLSEQAANSQTQYAGRQIQLGASTALNSYRSAIATFNSAKTALITAQAYYKDVLRQYKQGTVLYIELLDAQNEQIQAELRMYVALFDTYLKAAEAESANAAYEITTL
ncbi:MAG: TolC family protein [Chitinophagaceae bacterium]|nr:TolC family protein [Chitinophagaceae bacterium]